MKISEIHSAMLDAHSGRPQNQGLAELAVNDISDALARLEAMGHYFELVPSDPAKPQEFPQMLYHDRLPALVVHDATERGQARLEGYRETQQAEPVDPAIRPSQVAESKPAPAEPTT